jgi:hypothetical protein
MFLLAIIVFHSPEGHGSLLRTYLFNVNKEKEFFAQFIGRGNFTPMRIYL